MKLKVFVIKEEYNYARQFRIKEIHDRTEFYLHIIIAKPRDLFSPNSPKQFQLYFDQILANDAEQTNNREKPNLLKLL